MEPRIYKWWNHMAYEARTQGATEIAILNDDIVIARGTLPAMAEAMRSDPAVGLVCPGIGTPYLAPDIGLDAVAACVPKRMYCCFPGWNFMFPAELPVRFDEGYHWYGGDDAFENDVRLAGYRVAGVRGVYADHLGSWSDKKRTADAGSDPLLLTKERDHDYWETNKRLCPGWGWLSKQQRAWYAMTGEQRRAALREVRHA